MKKLAIIFTALVAVCFLTSSAMAIVLNTHSEEMYQGSACDRAGTVDIFFSAQDIAVLNGYLASSGMGGTAGFALLRFTLSGTDIDPTVTPPTLCTSIQFDSDGDTLADVTDDLTFATPLASWNNVVSLETIGVEVSDMDANLVRDFTAFVHGTAGNQYFEVIISAIDSVGVGAVAPAAYSPNYTDWPSLTIGLYTMDPGVTIATETVGVAESHAICVDVSAFSYLSKLEVSLDTTPLTLTYTPGDDQIGHFLVALNTAVCDSKDDVADCDYDATIPLCDNVDADGQTWCGDYHACFTAWGDWPDDDIYVRIYAPQAGVYLRGVTWSHQDPTVAIQAGGFVLYEESTLPVPLAGTETIATAGCTFDAKSAYTVIPSSSLPNSAIYEVAFCINYTVQSSELTVGTQIQFTAIGSSLPCGNLFSETINGGVTIDCEMAETCMYFPYVIMGMQADGWSTGIAVTNLSGLDSADMEVLFELTDCNGVLYSYTKNDYNSDQYVSATTVDQMVADFGWAPAGTIGWLRVVANFLVDGYQFNLYNGAMGMFGAGVLPRLVECDGIQYDGLDMIRAGEHLLRF